MSFNQREVLSIHIGQAGIQIGSELWRLYSREHDILADGKRQSHGDTRNDSGRNTFFEETSTDRFVPRSIFIDTEPTIIDEIRASDYRHLYNPNYLINGKEDSANNFVRGYHTLGRVMVDPVLEKIRQILERTNNLQGFFLCHSFGGGTGSGFSAKLIDCLTDEYPRLTKLQAAVYPAPNISSAIVEPYNAVLTTHATLDQVDCAFMFDNQAMYDIARTKVCIDQPSYSHLNSLMSQVLSGITASLRFNGSLNVDLDDFQTNLVPFPRIHFPVASYAPFMNATDETYEPASVSKITQQVFDSSNLMMKCDLADGKFVACCLLYRGDVVAKDINCAIQLIKSQRAIRFVDWCPTGFKIGNNSKPPVSLPSSDLSSPVRGVSLLASTTSIQGVFSALNRKFDAMYQKRAFTHWYLDEGMELFEFDDARTNLAALEKDYEEINTDL